MTAATARALSVCDQLAISRRYPALVPGLVRRGLSAEDAAALAHNAVFLYHALVFDPAPDSPGQLLSMLGAGQIARLCEQYQMAREGLEQTELRLPEEVEA